MAKLTKQEIDRHKADCRRGRKPTRHQILELDDPDLCDDAIIELARLRVAARIRRRIVPAEWPASGRIR